MSFDTMGGIPMFSYDRDYDCKMDDSASSAPARLPRPQTVSSRRLKNISWKYIISGAEFTSRTGTVRSRVLPLGIKNKVKEIAKRARPLKPSPTPRKKLGDRERKFSWAESGKRLESAEASNDRIASAIEKVQAPAARAQKEAQRAGPSPAAQPPSPALAPVAQEPAPASPATSDPASSRPSFFFAFDPVVREQGGWAFICPHTNKYYTAPSRASVSVPFGPVARAKLNWAFICPHTGNYTTATAWTTSTSTSSPAVSACAASSASLPTPLPPALAGHNTGSQSSPESVSATTTIVTAPTATPTAVAAAPDAGPAPAPQVYTAVTSNDGPSAPAVLQPPSAFTSSPSASAVSSDFSVFRSAYLTATQSSSAAPLPAQPSNGSEPLTQSPEQSVSTTPAPAMTGVSAVSGESAVSEASSASVASDSLSAPVHAEASSSSTPSAASDTIQLHADADEDDDDDADGSDADDEVAPSEDAVYSVLTFLPRYLGGPVKPLPIHPYNPPVVYDEDGVRDPPRFSLRATHPSDFRVFSSLDAGAPRPGSSCAAAGRDGRARRRKPVVGGTVDREVELKTEAEQQYAEADDFYTRAVREADEEGNRRGQYEAPFFQMVYAPAITLVLDDGVGIGNERYLFRRPEVHDPEVPLLLGTKWKREDTVEDLFEAIRECCPDFVDSIPVHAKLVLRGADNVLRGVQLREANTRIVKIYQKILQSGTLLLTYELPAKAKRVGTVRRREAFLQSHGHRAVEKVNALSYKSVAWLQARRAEYHLRNRMERVQAAEIERKRALQLKAEMDSLEKSVMEMVEQAKREAESAEDDKHYAEQEAQMAAEVAAAPEKKRKQLEREMELKEKILQKKKQREDRTMGPSARHNVPQTAATRSFVSGGDSAHVGQVGVLNSLGGSGVAGPSQDRRKKDKKKGKRVSPPAAINAPPTAATIASASGGGRVHVGEASASNLLDRLLAVPVKKKKTVEQRNSERQAKAKSGNSDQPAAPLQSAGQGSSAQDQGGIGPQRRMRRKRT